MAVTNIYSLTLIPMGLLMISRIYRADGKSACEDSNDQKTINKKSNVGSSVELSCNVTHNHFVGWAVVNKERTVKIIAIGNTTFSEHYSILFPSENNATSSTSSYCMYNLLINNFTDDQEGLYTCHDQGCNKAKVVLFVESGQRETRPQEEQQNAHITLIWPIQILLFVSGVIIITAIIFIAVFLCRKFLPSLASTSPYSLDRNESERGFPLSIYRKPPTISRHQFVDTSDEKYIPREEMTENGFSLGRTATSTTTETTFNWEEVDYLKVLE